MAIILRPLWWTLTENYAKSIHCFNVCDFDASTPELNVTAEIVIISKKYYMSKIDKRAWNMPHLHTVTRFGFFWLKTILAALSLLVQTLSTCYNDIIPIIVCTQKKRLLFTFPISENRFESKMRIVTVLFLSSLRLDFGNNARSLQIIHPK